MDRFVDFDLQDQIESLRQQEGSQRAFRSKTLAKYPDLSIVLICMDAGAHMKEHSAAGRITVLTLRGHIQLHVQEKLVDLPKGRLLTVDPALPHAVQALEDSAFLLTLAPALPA